MKAFPPSRDRCILIVYTSEPDMRTRIQKWGNSLGLRIPRTLAREIRVEAGAEVEVSVERGRLIIRPSPAARFHLKDLVAGITPENRHGETDWGPPVGRELL
jgi:antitoxin MazE